MGEKMTLEHIFSKGYSMETNLYFRTIFSRCIDISKIYLVAKLQFNSIYSFSLIPKRKFFKLLCLQNKLISERNNILS